MAASRPGRVQVSASVSVERAGRRNSDTGTCRDYSARPCWVAVTARLAGVCRQQASFPEGAEQQGEQIVRCDWRQVERVEGLLDQVGGIDLCRAIGSDLYRDMDDQSRTAVGQAGSPRTDRAQRTVLLRSFIT